MLIFFLLVFCELACKKTLLLQSFIYVISTTVHVCIKWLLFLKLHHSFLINSLQKFLSKEWNKIDTKYKRRFWIKPIMVKWWLVKEGLNLLSKSDQQVFWNYKQATNKFLKLQSISKKYSCSLIATGPHNLRGAYTKS